jgi:hypothetical protein
MAPKIVWTVLAASSVAVSACTADMPDATYAEGYRPADYAQPTVVQTGSTVVVNVYTGTGGAPAEAVVVQPGAQVVVPAPAPAPAPVVVVPAPAPQPAGEVVATAMPAECTAFFAATRACGAALVGDGPARQRFEETLRVAQGEMAIASTLPAERARIAERCRVAAETYEVSPCAR